MHSTRRLAGFGRNRLAWPGLAITAFVLGSILGPATVSAVAKATDVFVTNDASSPVPIAGTVSVGNLPAVQDVSGTVDVGTLPAPENVSGGINRTGVLAPSSGQGFTIQAPIDVTAVMFYSDQGAYLTIGTNAFQNGYRIVSAGEPVTQSFSNPLPGASTFVVNCEAASPCTWQFSVAGI